MTVPVARCSLLSRLSYHSVDDDEILMPFNRIRKIPGSKNELHEKSSQTRQLLEVDAVNHFDGRTIRQLHNLESGGSGNCLTVDRNIRSIR